MFLNEEAFKKNSLFGSFESQIRRGQYKQKENDSSSFQLLDFMKFSGSKQSFDPNSFILIHIVYHFLHLDHQTM